MQQHVRVGIPMSRCLALRSTNYTFRYRSRALPYDPKYQEEEDVVVGSFPGNSHREPTVWLESPWILDDLYTIQRPLGSLAIHAPSYEKHVLPPEIVKLESTRGIQPVKGLEIVQKTGLTLLELAAKEQAAA